MGVFLSGMLNELLPRGRQATGGLWSEECALVPLNAS
jgi:hypothetical protein